MVLLRNRVMISFLYRVLLHGFSLACMLGLLVAVLIPDLKTMVFVWCFVYNCESFMFYISTLAGYFGVVWHFAVLI